MSKVEKIILESSKQEDLDTNVVFEACLDITTNDSELYDTLDEIFYDIIKLSDYDVDIVSSIYSEDGNFFEIIAEPDYPDENDTVVYIRAKAENKEIYDKIISKIRSVLKTCGDEQLSDYSKSEYESSDFEVTYEYTIFGSSTGSGYYR